jgi:hypothetical protein
MALSAFTSTWVRMAVVPQARFMSAARSARSAMSAAV